MTPPDAASSRRRSRRRRLLLAGLVPALVAAAFTVKVVTMTRADQEGIARFEHHAYSDARSAFARNLTANVLETWVAWYDDGTARYVLGDYAGAEVALRDALSVVPAEDACRVRVNLALTLEAKGDQALAKGEVPSARAAWQGGRETLGAGSCLSVASAATGGRGSATAQQAGDARAIDDRLRNKLSDKPPRGQGHTTVQSARAAEALAELNQRAERARHRAQQHQEDEEDKKGKDDGPAPPTQPDTSQPPIYHW